jgi:hypothetical protein
MDLSATMQDREPLDTATSSSSAQSRTIYWLTWAFVGLGVLLRAARYGQNYPLWWDEAFVGVNLLKRGYLDMLRPLDYGQVCPLLFLWVELTAVKLLGFSEPVLRLFPLLCGVGSVMLFRTIAGRVLTGVPLLLSVAILAVAYHPIRHSADVKPYASDLLVALILLGLTIEWWRRRDGTIWLWALAAFGPVAVALCYPAAFVTGGLILALIPAVWRTHQRSAWIAWIVFLIGTVGTFLTLFVLMTSAQADETLPGMRADWAGSFPPWRNPLALARWLITIHAGSMLAYPFGGERGASALTFVLVAVGIVALWRRGRTLVVAACLAPLAVAFVAAAMHRYPYGGSPRFMLYVGPAACLLAGYGAALVWSRISRPRIRSLVLGVGLIALAAVGVGPATAELFHPYRSVHAERSREFARRFWPSLAADSEVGCLLWDFGLGRWNSIHLNVAVYLCNQRIYSPARKNGCGPRWAAISKCRPLRCVIPLTRDIQEEALSGWTRRMASQFELRARNTVVVNMAEAGAPARIERYRILEFVPNRTTSSAPVASTR